MMQVSTPKPRLSLRRTRSRRFRPTFPGRRQQQSQWRLVGAAALPLVVLGIVAYVARRRVFQGIAILAKAVEEVADTVEDAAEDLVEAAEARAQGGEPKK